MKKKNLSKKLENELNSNLLDIKNTNTKQNIYGTIRINNNTIFSNIKKIKNKIIKNKNYIY